MKRILAACFLALAFVSPAWAELSSLAVQFAPNATHYTKGDVVSVTATSNGTNAQYRFILEKVGVSVVAVSSSSWTTNNSYQIDTFAVNMPAGKYRLRVIARESANKPEILNKYEFFSVVAPTVVACDLIDGKTYTNPGAMNYSSLGSYTLAQILGGFVLTMSGGSSGVASVSFDAGTVTAAVKDVSAQACIFLCLTVAAPVADLTGTYTCSGNTVTVSATGSTTGGSSSLYSALGAEAPVSLSGSMTINTSTDTLTAGGRTFQ